MKIFCPVSRQPVAVALGTRLEAAWVGARARLGQRVAAQRLAGCERREAGVPAARRCRTAPRSCRTGRSRRRRCRGRSSRRDRSPRRRACRRSCRAPSRRAPPGEQRRGSRARRELLDDAAVDRLGAIPLGREGRDLCVAERARGRANELLLFAELKVHSAIQHDLRGLQMHREPTSSCQVSERGSWGENRRCSPQKNIPPSR